MTLASGREFLSIPGPTTVPDAVKLNASGVPVTLGAATDQPIFMILLAPLSHVIGVLPVPGWIGRPVPVSM